MWAIISMIFFLKPCFYSLSLCFSLILVFFTSFFSKKIMFVSYYFKGDFISIYFSILTLWIFFLMKIVTKNSKNLTIMMTFMKLMLIISFLSSDFMKFFIFFELSMIPALLMILGWGVQPERLLAGSYLMIYTFLGSMPLMFSLVWMTNLKCTTNFFVWQLQKKLIFLFFEWKEYSMILYFFILGFLMKLPLYGMHLWLPKAHVEAPIVGSMILAGVLLKLGSYGLMRVFSLFHFSKVFSSIYLKFWVLCSLMMVSLICFRQNDLKSLVAYSSVGHMSLMVLAFYSSKYIGLMGVLFMSVAHGVCSSGLFAKVKTFYQLSKSRKILFNRGIFSFFPMLCFFFFLLCASKSSMPPSINLFSEIFLIISYSIYSVIGLFFFFVSMFLVGLFSIYLYSLMSHGKWKLLNKKNVFMKFSKILVLFLHLIPCIFLFFFSKKII